MSKGFFSDEAESTYNSLLQEFYNLAINRFKWEGLPFGLDSETLERCLIDEGLMMFYKDKSKGFFLLPCMGTRDINVYGKMTEYEIKGINGTFQGKKKLEEGVLLKNNPLAKPEKDILESYARKIDSVGMTMEVNLFQQCIPKIILGNEDTKLTARNLIDQIQKFKMVVIGKKAVMQSLTTSDILDTSAPYLLDKLQIFKQQLYNELLTKLGINNTDIMKKERVVTSEVDSNNELIKTLLDLMYDMRVKFCEEVKEKFNYEISVMKREVEENAENNNTEDSE